MLQAMLWAQILQLKRVVIFLLSPLQCYLKENCTQAVAAVRIWLPKDITGNDELGLTLFYREFIHFLSSLAGHQ